MASSEFSVQDAYRYSYRSPIQWIISHLMRYPLLPVGGTLVMIAASFLWTRQPLLIGAALDVLVRPAPDVTALLWIAAAVLGLAILQSGFDMAANAAIEFSAQRIERDARDELLHSLLGKSQAFHARQRVGDVMARATNDVRQLNFMLSPGFRLILDSLITTIMLMISIAFLRLELLLVPVLFTIGFGFALRHYTRQLEPITGRLRQQFGKLNTGLEESIEGIEVVKAYAQEAQEQSKFLYQARHYRELFVQQGKVQALYLPMLVYAVSLGLALVHALLLFQRGTLTIGEVVAFMGLMGGFYFPTHISIWSFSMMQLGLAAARRVLELILTETELDQNPAGVARPVRGQITFENVSLELGGAQILRDVSFQANPGETIAIVGQTGSGKTTLTKLVNRTYDTTTGRVLVDGVDVRDWDLDSLRSQISLIEQDVFLFSRTIAENIGFGARGEVTRGDVEEAAREAQADGFIRELPNGYDTVIGERGVTLSGGQRQRIAIARALLSDPRILILDDSTSAIDSATEDQIQRAIGRVRQGRTTLLITHRLSQIRWADRILVLRRGELVDHGSHEDLLQRSTAYRRIFAGLDAQPMPAEAG